MKTTMKKLAAGTFVALMILAGSVRANGTESNASSHENREASLKIENWMVNENVWNKNIAKRFVFSVEQEQSLQIENWMTSEKTWKTDNQLAEEREEKLQLEEWMTKEKIWNLKS